MQQLLRKGTFLSQTAVFKELFGGVHPGQHTCIPGEGEEITHTKFRHGNAENLKYFPVSTQFGEGNLLFGHDRQSLKIDAADENVSVLVISDLLIKTVVKEIAGDLHIRSIVRSRSASCLVKRDSVMSDETFADK